MGAYYSLSQAFAAEGDACVGHRAMHELFEDPNAAVNFTYPETVPAVGTVGDPISVTTQFDGWGYLHLFDAATGWELDPSR